MKTLIYSTKTKSFSEVNNQTKQFTYMGDWRVRWINVDLNEDGSNKSAEIRTERDIPEHIKSASAAVEYIKDCYYKGKWGEDRKLVFPVAYKIQDEGYHDTQEEFYEQEEKLNEILEKINKKD